MKLAITDGCDGGQHHVEAIEPRPTFHVVEAKHSNEHERDQAEEENLQIEQGFHSSHSGASGREAQCPNIKIRFCGEVEAPQLWRWSSFSAYAYQEKDPVGVNQRSVPKLKTMEPTSFPMGCFALARVSNPA